MDASSFGFCCTFLSYCGRIEWGFSFPGGGLEERQDLSKNVVVTS